jgi:hypothetical protein
VAKGSTTAWTAMASVSTTVGTVAIERQREDTGGVALWPTGKPMASIKALRFRA